MYIGRDFQSGGKVLIIPFRKYITSYSVVPLCEGSETLIECKSMYCQIYGRTDGMTGVGAGDTIASKK